MSARITISMSALLLASQSLLAVDRFVPGQYPTIQEAIDASADGDAVIVSAGTYVENIDFWGKAITVRSTDPNAPGTVAATIIDGGAVSIVVSFHSDEGPESVITGFTITNGAGTYGAGITCWTNCSPTISKCVITDNHASSDGGGIYCRDGASPLIEYCEISDNTATYGGGIFADNALLVITGCSISGNAASWGGGGGVYAAYCTLTLSSCRVTANLVSDSWGAGIYADDSTVAVSGCGITDNRAQGSYGSSAGIYCQGDVTMTACTVARNTADGGTGGLNASGVVSINACTFVENTAGTVGGCEIYGTGAVQTCAIVRNSARWLAGGTVSGTQLLIQDCTIAENFAQEMEAGGISASNVTLIGCAVERNTSQTSGGGIWVSGNARIEACRVVDNRTAGAGGGVYFSQYSTPTIVGTLLGGNEAADRGGGVFAGTDAEPAIIGCTLVGNKAASGGGGIHGDEFSTTTIYNNIISDSAAGEGIYLIYADANIDYNNVWNNAGGDYGGWAGPGPNDISADPLFIDPGHWDDNGTPTDPNDDFWVDGEYHLQATSPCIDAGGDSAGVLFSDTTTAPGTTTTIEVSYSTAPDYSVDKEIEYDNDGVLRTLTAIGYTTLTFDDPLPAPSEAGKPVNNYGYGDIDGEDRLYDAIPATTDDMDMGADEYQATLARPTPDPMRFVQSVYQLEGGVPTLHLEAAPASIPGSPGTGVEYYFESPAGAVQGPSSGWQSSATFLVSNPEPDTYYTYWVKARNADQPAAETSWSSMVVVLTRLDGDFDLDGDVDMDDFGTFAACYNGSGAPPAATCPAGVDADFDDDGDVDLDDFAIFAASYTGAR